MGKKDEKRKEQINMFAYIPIYKKNVVFKVHFEYLYC